MAPKSQARTDLPAIVQGHAGISSALTALSQKNPELATPIINFIEGIARRDIRILGGDNELFVIRSPGGKAVATMRRVTLSVEEGSLTSVPGVGIIPGAPAYKRLAEAANLLVINAPTVIVDGRVEQNPCVRRDVDGHPEEVYCRAIALGHTATGIPCVSDRTVVFDLGTYRMVDLLAKAKRYPQAFRVGPRGCPPEEAGWVEYRIDGVAAVFVDLSNPEAIDWLRSTQNRVKKAVEFAQTFAQRNATKHHPAIPIVKIPDGKSSVVVPVVGWLQVEGKFKWNLEQYAQAMEAAEQCSGNITAAGGATIKGVDHFDTEADMQGVIEEDDTDAEPAETVPTSPRPAPQQTPGSLFPADPVSDPTPANGKNKGPVASQASIKKIQSAIEFMGDGAVESAKKTLGIDKKIWGMTDDEITKIIGEMNRVADAEGGL